MASAVCASSSVATIAADSSIRFALPCLLDFLRTAAQESGKRALSRRICFKFVHRSGRLNLRVEKLGCCVLRKGSVRMRVDQQRHSVKSFSLVSSHEALFLLDTLGFWSVRKRNVKEYTTNLRSARVSSLCERFRGEHRSGSTWMLRDILYW